MILDNIKIENNKCIIRLEKTFTFKNNRDYEDIINYIQCNQKDIKELVLDFKDCEFIDTAAMGILILLSDECDSNNIKKTITNLSHQPKRILDNARFDILFNFEKSS